MAGRAHGLHMANACIESKSYRLHQRWGISAIQESTSQRGGSSHPGDDDDLCGGSLFPAISNSIGVELSLESVCRQWHVAILGIPKKDLFAGGSEISMASPQPSRIKRLLLLGESSMSRLLSVSWGDETSQESP
mmetsp:Transcript_18717/g.38726  ORF Transcript_18717/g.38726 Transcript_18717/m.38726 type:complete len:134 (+) Transcript_18717:733-1134(+)